VRSLAILACATGIGCNDVGTIDDVAYDDRFGASTTMDVYLPADRSGDGPAILMIHGGGWSSFSKDVYRDHGARLAGAGYVVASINYRLVPEAAYPEVFQDVMCALAFFQSKAGEYGFDPARVAVTGYSAGGHLSSLVGVGTAVPELAPDCAAGIPEPPAAVISGAGPEDMRLLPEVAAVTDLLGGTADEVPERYDIASPITHVGPRSPPFLFIHGTDDVFVDIEHSRVMRDALAGVGVEARLLELAGSGHILNPGVDVGHFQLVISATDTPEAWAATLDFLDRTVGAP
jgi:acetyl esterase/lipase